MENVIQSSGLLQPSACGIPGLTQTQTVQPSRETASSLWPDFLAGQPGQPVRVLLIDDDASIRKVIANELLGDLRTDLVAQGSSVREGRRLISQHEFDVMLIDLSLGDGSGFELIEYMKSVQPWPKRW